MVDRAELERMDRDALIARAESAGVTRARILTRPELVDELLLRAARTDPTASRARGLFGRARDLLARVIERGLHLPDAADRIRGSTPPPPARNVPAALPTVTLAEIYAAQGHRDRAIDTLKRVIEREPEHAAARALLTQLEDSTYAFPKPALPPEDEEPSLSVAASGSEAKKKEPEGPAEPLGMLDDEPLPQRYDVDECVAIPVDPTSLFIYWEVRDRTLDHVRSTRAGGTLALRLVIIEPTWDGPRTSMRDHDVNAQLGDWFERGLPPGCVVRAAIGWRVGNTFVPIAHSPALETPPGGPSPILADVLVRWTPHGVVPITPHDRDAESIARALGIVNAYLLSEQGAMRAGAGLPPLGSSERRAFGPGGKPLGASEGFARRPS